MALGFPDSELTATPASATIGGLAADCGLGLAHFEHRRGLELPEHWRVPDPDLGPEVGHPDASWRAGSLPETKFRSFRLDRRIGSFHPAHGPKWTAHELCHGLVGFGWRPDASLLWHATAARLAELLPVALWYFFDEGGRRRCPRHAGGGPLWKARCPDCEAILEPQPADPALSRWRSTGRAYVESEIDAAWRTLELGVPVSHRHGTLDLCTDGLAYVRAHGPILQSRAFAAWVERFCTEDTGWHSDLDGLAGRVRDLVASLCDEGEPPGLGGHRGTWIVQDVGWRLMQLRQEVDGVAGEGLSELIDHLASRVSSGPDVVEDTLSDVISAYLNLYDEYVLMPPGELFAVGYPLPHGFGSDLLQLMEGVVHCLPATAARLGDNLAPTVAHFAADELSGDWIRAGLGERFAAWARDTLAPAQADLAAVEAAITHVDAPDPALWTLRAEAGSRTTVPRHVRLVEVVHDVSTDPQDTTPMPVLDEPLTLAVRRDLDGTRELLALTEAQADGLRLGHLDADDEDALLGGGIVVPAAWPTD